VGLCRASARENIKRKNDERSQKQQVNQVGGDKTAHKPNRPQQQQHYQNYPQHDRISLISKTLPDPLKYLDVLVSYPKSAK